MKNKNQGHHLQDKRIHPKNNSTGEVQFGGLKISESFAGGNSVVIRNLISYCIYIFTFSMSALENKIKISIMA
jgi:hypothetical protein